MSQPTYGSVMNSVAHRWRDLAEKRRLHLLELYDSGRWRHYYSEREFHAAMRDAVNATERWSALAPQVSDERPELAHAVA
jgi:uncharacterized repeat protein (TIGR03809 family)